MPLTLIGELVQPEHGVLIEAAGVERLDQRSRTSHAMVRWSFSAQRRILGRVRERDAADRRAEIHLDQRSEDFVLGLEVMEQRRLPDLHSASAMSRVEVPGSRAGANNADAASRMRPRVDATSRPPPVANPVRTSRAWIVTPNRSMAAERSAREPSRVSSDTERVAS